MIIKRKVGLIGRTEIISLPDYGIDGVVAKIDTGADSSSIFASNISLINNQLSFCLFDPYSSYYTGEVITTSHYSVVKVRNSFGDLEDRYKVILRIKLKNRLIKAKFTLADRSKNSYPVLIGRRTISKKFLVDVSEKINQ